MKTIVLSLLVLPLISHASATQNAPAPRAVQCVSVFEIMDRAAPTWMSQPSVQQAKQIWQSQAKRLTDQAEVDLGTQLNREMVRLADLSAQSPDTLSEIAVNCLAEAQI